MIECLQCQSHKLYCSSVSCKIFATPDTAPKTPAVPVTWNPLVVRDEMSNEVTFCSLFQFQ
eukprot:TRINITY_DN9545_c0_g1_i1.p3 TRINITY_DN9545_c0_g1~~TRINITY_DN9545_c0_g1_i1.p3  ORF type:complete len:61 (-),score=7.03 TRINITY_DN9545_c0_g1_i1:95-277(-)